MVTDQARSRACVKLFEKAVGELRRLAVTRYRTGTMLLSAKVEIKVGELFRWKPQLHWLLRIAA